METSYVSNWKDHLSFSDNGALPQNIIEDSNVRVVLGTLKPGQQIPAHPEEKAVYQFMEGRGVMIVNGQELPVQQGTVLMVPAGAIRAMTAETRLVFLAVRMKLENQ